MASDEVVRIVGNLGGDPEMRYTPDGTPVTNFSVAVNRQWKDASGGEHKETKWFRVSAWRRQAEVCNQYLKKGREVTVVGELRADPDTGGPRVFQRQDGTYGASYELTARKVIFHGGAQGGNGAPAAPPEEEEIPF